MPSYSFYISTLSGFTIINKTQRAMLAHGRPDTRTPCAAEPAATAGSVSGAAALADLPCPERAAAAPAAVGSAHAAAASARRACAWGLPCCMREREGESTVRVPMLTMAACFTVGANPDGVLKPGSVSVGHWPALALWMGACTLTRECSAIWALTAHCVYVRLLELARMIEIVSV